MLQPSRTAYRKHHRGRRRGRAARGNVISFGEWGLQAQAPAWIEMKRGGKVWIRIFPDKTFTKKPAETRMGKGKGAPEGWVAVVKPDRILFEISGVPEEVAREALRLAAHKLPIKTKVVRRDELVI